MLTLKAGLDGNQVIDVEVVNSTARGWERGGSTWRTRGGSTWSWRRGVSTLVSKVPSA